MNSFIMYNPVRIVFGSGEVKRAGKEAPAPGKRALIVTGKFSAKKTGLLDRVTRLLKKEKIGYVIYSHVTPNPKVDEVNEAASLAREDNSDFVIGLGGGSAMDAAKGAAIVAENGGSVWDYVAGPGKKAEQIKSALPIMLIPTLAGTGSEGNPAAVFTNEETKEKAGIYNPARLFPKVSIVDPETTLSVPEKQTAEGIIDIIAHVLEEYLTDENSPGLQDRVSEGIIHTCMQNGYRLMRNPGDLEAREQVSLAGTLALHGIANYGRKGRWVLHPIEHAVSGIYDNVAHGAGIAAFLGPYLRFVSEVNIKRVVQLSKRIFSTPGEVNDYAHIDICIKGFRNFIKDMNLPAGLKKLGIERQKTGGLVEKVIAVSGMPHPKLNKQRLKKIFTGEME